MVDSVTAAGAHVLAFAWCRRSWLIRWTSAAARPVTYVVTFLAMLSVTGDLVFGQSRQPPNVFLILADDLGWSDLHCYGSRLHETPFLDQFAGQRVLFRHAYTASPVCSPTRASILTGRHPARLQMTIWREAALSRGRNLLEPLTRDQLPLIETPLAEILHRHGYYTAHVGKCHLGRAETYPQPHGFDVNIGGTLWEHRRVSSYPFRGDQYFRDFRYLPDLEPSHSWEYLTDRLTDKALEIIERQKDGPLYLNWD